jgi:MFS transporter, PPP family, 3-phenylpropionic acid transporter
VIAVLPSFRLFYFFYYGAGATLVPYLVLHYRAAGLAEGLVGVLAAVPPLVTLAAATFWGGLADATRSHGRVLAGCLFGAAACSVAVGAGASFAPLLAAVAAWSFFLAPIIPIADDTVLAALAGEPGRYGTVRVWGAVGWGIAGGIGGLLAEHWGLRAAFAAYAVQMVACFAVVLATRVTPRPHAGAYWRGLRTLLAQPQWISFLLLLLAGGIGLATVNSYLFLYLSDMGASATVMGLSLTIATVSELVVFVLSGRIIDRIGPRALLLLGTAATAARLAAYALVRTPTPVLAIQLVHGLSFSATWVAAVTFAHRMAPPGLGATAQALVGGVTFGVAAAAGAAIGGLLYQAGGPFAMYGWVAVGLFAALLAYLPFGARGERTPAA